MFILVATTILVAQTETQPAKPVLTQPLVILIGPPMSGKTMLVSSITKTYGIPNISIEDLIRDNAAELDKLRGEGVSMAEMRYDPAMSRYLRERLKTTDLSRGLALDGYPATLVQAEELPKMFADTKLSPIAFRLNVPDDVIYERAKKSGRESDNKQIIAQRIKDYRREMSSIGLYFPNAKIIDVDGTKAEPEVLKAIEKSLDEAGVRRKAQ